MTPLLLALAAFPFVIAAMGAAFRRRQNSGKIVGGDISWPKALWLAYTVMSWFVLPWLLLAIISANGAILHPSLKWITYLHLASWWVRGPLELFMIYKWFNWSPRYGISHDLVHVAMLAIGFAISFDSMAFWFSNPYTSLLAFFLFFTFFTTLAEALFAFLFFHVRTEGEDLIYFASDEPRWKMINRITLTVVIASFAHLGFQSFQAFRLLFSAGGD